MQINQFSTNTQVDYVGGTNAIYVGNAVPGSSTSVAVWSIMKITYDGNNNPIQVQYAGGTPASNFQWTQRTTYTYS